MSELLNQVSIARESYFDEDGKIHYIDYGDVIIIDNTVFEKSSITLLEPTYTMEPTDKTNISGITFEYDDNGVISGECHREWTPIEVAIASLPQFNFPIVNHPTDFLSNMGLDMFTENLKWIAPESGILRVSHISVLTSPVAFSIYVNGKIRTKIISNITSVPTTIYSAIPLIVKKGDEISIPNIYTRIMLLPFKYNVD